MSLLIENKIRDEVAKSLAAYLPGGDLWEAGLIPGTNLHAVMLGQSGNLLDIENFIKVYNSQFIPSSPGTDFLEDWERALSIPDSCFPGPAEPDRQIRRTHVLVKLAALGVQTAADFERLGLIFGKVITVSALSEKEFPPYDVPFNPIAAPGSRFTIVVSGENIISGVPPYDVPFDLIVGESIMECVFTKLKPANCKIIFRNTN